MTTITPGMRIAGFEVLSIVPGKRAIVSCGCGATHVISIEALLDGSAACAARPLPPDRRMALQTEITERRAKRDRDWRPGR